MRLATVRFLCLACFAGFAFLSYEAFALRVLSVGVSSPDDLVIHEFAPKDTEYPSLGSVLSKGVRHRGAWVRDGFESIQVNVDEEGYNIVGDAANEPSICVDPTRPTRMAIGWRQFPSIDSDYRCAGVGYSSDGGATWTFDSPLTPFVFGSDPVLRADSEGTFYYVSINGQRVRLFRSFDGGKVWERPIQAVAGFRDKEWLAIDRTGGVGEGNLYMSWSGTNEQFSRSTDGGVTWMEPINTPLSATLWSTNTVGPDGEVYIADRNNRVVKSINAQDPEQTPLFFSVGTVDLGGVIGGSSGPNPGGLTGQNNLIADCSDGPGRGNLYLLASVDVEGSDPMDVMFARSTDGGQTWSEPVRVNDDSPLSGAWQWFGTMSVSPTGRIDVIWNDTRNTGEVNLGELHYAYSLDQGDTWSANVAVSPVFDSWIGWPQQNKLGDYYDMRSDEWGVDIAYAATFNGEQDVYYLRVGSRDCNDNQLADECDLSCGDAGGSCDVAGCGQSSDCNVNGIPDECEDDCDENGVADECDIAAGAADCNANGILDSCIHLEVDCNDNLIPDECDIDTGGSDDCTGNGIPDECEEDCNDNGVADSCDLLNGTSDDCNGDQVPDDCSGDCNGNDIWDVCDIFKGVSVDCNANGMPDECETLGGANRLFVSASATAGGSGVSWDQALLDLSSALCIAANDGGVSEIWVAKGVYTPFAGRDGRESSFEVPSGVALYGGFDGTERRLSDRDLVRNVTVLSGDLLGDDQPDGLKMSDNAYQVVRLVDCDDTTVIDGFVIMSGMADGESPLNSGGGMYCANSEAQVRNCRFLSCQSLGGGGAIYLTGDAPLAIENCVFSGNSSIYVGGAISASVPALLLDQCTFYSNSASSWGGGVYAGWSTTLTLNGCIFRANSDGGGVDGSAQVHGTSIESSFCCVERLDSSFDGEGNFDLDPSFVNVQGEDGFIGTLDDDLRLTWGSPCYNTGDPSKDVIAGSTDADGHGRVLCGRVDVGAFELGSGDYTCNGVVDIDDFADWDLCLTGPAGELASPLCAPLDLNGDGFIDLHDFTAFQSIIEEGR